MAKQYSSDMLQAGDTFVVRGRTSYPKLTRVLDGEELQEEIKRATQQGRIPTTIPHSYTTLTDAVIEYANPNAPTLAELFAQERLYVNKEGKQCYAAVRKAQTLAEYGVVDPMDYTKVQGIYLDPSKTLANGLDVRCYFRIFDTKAGMHKGVSLDTIVFLEPVRYYEFSNADSQLAARGLTWTPPVGEPPQYQTQATQPQTEQMPMPNGTPYGAPQPSQQMHPYPTEQPVQTPQTTQAATYPNQTPMPQAAPNQGYGYPSQTPAYGAQASMPSQTPTYGAQAPMATQTPNYPAMQTSVPQQQPPFPMQSPSAPMTSAQMPYAQNAGNPQVQADPYAGNVPQPTGPQQTIGNASGASAFDGAYQY